MKNILVVLTAVLMTTSLAHASELTPEYLLGEWCFESIGFGSQVTKENKNWVFEKDGKFLMQQLKHSKKIKYSGIWDIKNKKLQIKPVYMGGYLVIEIVSQDKFIFKWSGDIHVVRGVCK